MYKSRFIYRCKDLNEDPAVIVKWLRRQFGERGIGWDFQLTGGNITIEIWNTKYEVIYRLWKE